MPQFIDLDEYSNEALLAELARRGKARSLGLCDYCGRKPSTSPCQFTERHAKNADREAELKGVLTDHQLLTITQMLSDLQTKTTVPDDMKKRIGKVLDFLAGN